MGTLTFRAEQALLGALLRQPGLPARLGYLETGDFALAQHRRVYAAITAAAGTAVADGRRPWRNLVADVAGPEVDAKYLEELEWACPDPAHGPAYGRLVMEASVRRSLLADADELDGQGKSIGDSARRMLHAGVDGDREVGAYAGYTAEVARLLRSHASRFSPDTAVAVAAPAESAAAGPAGERARKEELVLAALIQGHPDARPAVATVPAEAFTHPVRREVFQAVAEMYRSGRRREADALTVDWQIVSARAHGPGQPTTGALTDDEPSYATRLAMISIAGRPVAQMVRALAAAPVQHGSAAPVRVAGPVPGANADAVTARSANGTAPGTRLIHPLPPQPGRGPGPVQGR